MDRETRGAQITVRLRQSIREAAETAADADRRTLSQWVELAIEEVLKARGFLADSAPGNGRQKRKNRPGSPRGG